jgi:hypothetical protein
MESEPGWTEWLMEQTSIDPVTVGALLVGASQKAAERRDAELLATDTERARARARRERLEAESAAMAAAMGRPGCGTCYQCRNGWGCRYAA